MTNKKTRQFVALPQRVTGLKDTKIVCTVYVYIRTYVHTCITCVLYVLVYSLLCSHPYVHVGVVVLILNVYIQCLRYMCIIRM